MEVRNVFEAMKTAIQEIQQASKRLSEEKLSLWLFKNLRRLLELERQQITEAWMAGNKEGSAQTTDWPEDAQRYYERKFNSEK